MKKRMKKLALHRETLRSLEGGQMGRVAGGVDTSEACIEATGCCDSQGGTDCYSPTMCLWGCSLSAETCRHC